MMRLRLLILTLLLGIVPAAQAQHGTYQPMYEREPGKGAEEGTELIMIYFGSPTCAPCLTAEVKQAVEQAKVLLDEYADANGLRFFAVGASASVDVDNGLAFLRETGKFDELVVGRGILNSMFLVHSFSRPGSSGALPNVLVLERDLAFPADTTIAVSAPRYRADIIGDANILKWVEAGAPLP